MVDQPSRIPAGVDTSRPSAARVYDYYLGGFHNFAADREMAERAIAMWPDLPLIMKANRAFLRRAVTDLIQRGVRQFLDIGSGIPTVGGVHEVAQALAPDSRVVYVDLDPVAVAHTRVILEGEDHSTVLLADLREPASIVESPEVNEFLDLSQPIGVLLVAVMHFIEDDAQAAASVRAVRDASPAGSYLALSHAALDLQDPELAASHRDLYRQTATPMRMRTREEVMTLFDGYDLVSPGLVQLDEWPSGAPQDAPADSVGTPAWAGIGKKI